MFRSGLAALLVAASMPAPSQPGVAVPPASAPGAATTQMTPMERAQRDADKVFYWVRLHGNAQPRTPAKETLSNTVGKTASLATPAQARRPAPVARIAATQPTVPAIPAATAPDANTERSGEPEPTAQAQPDPPADQANAEPAPADRPAPATEAAAVATVPVPQAQEQVVPVRATDAAEERLQPIAQPSPVFPAALIKTLGRGTVRLQFNVMPDGSVDAAEVISTTHARLNAAALAAVQQWRFQPVSRAQPAVVDLAFNVE